MYKVIYLNAEQKRKRVVVDSQEELLQFLNTLNFLDCTILKVEKLT